MLQKSFPSKISHSLIIVRYNHFLNPLLYLFVIEQQKKLKKILQLIFRAKARRQKRRRKHYTTNKQLKNRLVELRAKEIHTYYKAHLYRT